MRRVRVRCLPMPPPFPIIRVPDEDGRCEGLLSRPAPTTASRSFSIICVSSHPPPTRRNRLALLAPSLRTTQQAAAPPRVLPRHRVDPEGTRLAAFEGRHLMYPRPPPCAFTPFLGPSVTNEPPTPKSFSNGGRQRDVEPRRGSHASRQRMAAPGPGLTSHRC